jgi:hypothetical protein
LTIATIVRGLKNLQKNKMTWFYWKSKPLTYDWLDSQHANMVSVFYLFCHAVVILNSKQRIYLWNEFIGIINFIGIIVLGNQYFSKCIGDCICDLVEKEAKWNLHSSKVNLSSYFNHSLRSEIKKRITVSNIGTNLYL